MARVHQVAAESVAAFNTHDIERLRALYAADVVLEAPGDVRFEGVDAALDYTRRWQRAFPDSQMSVVTEFVDGDRAALRFVLEGTHEDTLAGSLGELAATNRRVALDGVMLVRVAAEGILEHTVFFDRAQLLGQLGLAPEPTLTA